MNVAARKKRTEMKQRNISIWADNTRTGLPMVRDVLFGAKLNAETLLCRHISSARHWVLLWVKNGQFC